MSDFTINDSTWQGTFPHLVSPLADEWLPGLLLRCDQANGWNSGIAQSFIRLSDKYLYQQPETYVFAEDLDLEVLAHYLAIPSPSTLLETTFRSALWGLYGTDRTHEMRNELSSSKEEHAQPLIDPATEQQSRSVPIIE